MFLENMKSVTIVSSVSGSRKFKMAAANPKIPISELVNEIERQFQRYLTSGYIAQYSKQLTYVENWNT